MFVIWRHQNAIRWKNKDWLQNFFKKKLREEMLHVSRMAIKNKIIKDVSVSVCVCAVCQRKQEKQDHRDSFLWISRTQCSVASMDLRRIWPWFNLSGLGWVRDKLGPRSHCYTRTYLSQQAGGGGCVIWGSARYTALVTVLTSRQGFLFGSQLKRTTVRKRTEKCVWASMC